MKKNVPEPSEYFEGRLEFERLLADLSLRFISLPPDQVDREIEGALHLVCELFRFDYAVLWQWSTGAPGVVTPTHFYTASGALELPIPNARADYPFVEREIMAGRMVALRSPEELPSGAAVDRESCHSVGIKSNLTLPLSVGGEAPVGALAFNTLRVHRDWPDALVQRLRLVAQVFTNALARRRADESLRESEERLRVAADAAGVGLWTLDYATGTIWATEKGRAIFGYSPDEPIDMARFQASVHPDDWELVRGAIERSQRAGDPVRVEYRIVTPGGDKLRWIASQGRRRVDAAGRAERLMGISIDVTDRKHAEEALRASEARLVAGADLAGLGFYEVDWVGRVAFFDTRLRDLLGLPPEPAHGLEDVEFFLARLHPDDRPRFSEQRAKLDDGRLERVAIEYRYLHPDRGERWLHHVARVATRDAKRRTWRSYGVLRDITEQRQREEALRQSLAEIQRLKDRLEQQNDFLKAEIKLVHPHGEVVGRSTAIRQVLRLVEQVAATDSTVVIRGDTGTGKELIAQAIHRLSRRGGRLMVTVNCAALPSGLVESELFGREKGAYTGALTRQIGRFEIADGSTLFLDEVGELSLEVQAKLLRVLETGELERLGSAKTIKVDVRVIAATHRDLTESVRLGRFREDLFYRLDVFPIHVPPLRERADDIPLLVWAFLDKLCSRMGKKITRVPRRTMDALQRHSWPGNVRELRNVIEHAVIVTESETLEVHLLEGAARVVDPPRTLAEHEREIILQTLDRTHWRIKGPQGAAAQLGLNASTLYGRMKKLGIRLAGSAERGSA